MSERRIYVDDAGEGADDAGEGADDAGEGADALASSPTLCCNLIVGPSTSTIETRPESSPTALARSLDEIRRRPRDRRRLHEQRRPRSHVSHLVANTNTRETTRASRAPGTGGRTARWR